MTFDLTALDNYERESFDYIFALIDDLATCLSDDGKPAEIDRATTLELLPHAIQIWIQLEKWRAANGV